MAESLENSIAEISNVYTANNIDRYLKVQELPPPPAPKGMFFFVLTGRLFNAIFDGAEKLHTAYLFVFDRDGYFEKKESVYHDEQSRQTMAEFVDKSNKEYEQELESQGLLAQIQKDAHFIAKDIGDGLARRIFLSHLIQQKEPQEDLEILEMENDRSTKTIRVTQKLFDKYLKCEVNTGVGSLISLYNGGIEVNPEFAEKTLNWLKEEINTRLNQGKEVKLLERVMLKRDNAGRIELTQLPDPYYKNMFSEYKND